MGVGEAGKSDTSHADLGPLCLNAPKPTVADPHATVFLDSRRSFRAPPNDEVPFPVQPLDCLPATDEWMFYPAAGTADAG